MSITRAGPGWLRGYGVGCAGGVPEPEAVPEGPGTPLPVGGEVVVDVVVDGSVVVVVVVVVVSVVVVVGITGAVAAGGTAAVAVGVDVVVAVVVVVVCGVARTVGSVCVWVRPWAGAGGFGVTGFAAGLTTALTGLGSTAATRVRLLCSVVLWVILWAALCDLTSRTGCGCAHEVTAWTAGATGTAAWSGVSVRSRRVQARLAAGASKLISCGYGTVRWNWM